LYSFIETDSQPNPHPDFSGKYIRTISFAEQQREFTMKSPPVLN
jgi:hypothetical protein